MNGGVRPEQSRTEHTGTGTRRTEHQQRWTELKVQRCGELGGIRGLVAFIGRKRSFCCEARSVSTPLPISTLVVGW